MKIQTINISDIKEAFYNPRKVIEKGSKTYNDLRGSLENFGCVEPLVVNDVNMRLISGHQRMKVLKDMGETQVTVSLVHIEDEKREKALNISLNKIKGKWDEKKLSDVLKEIGDRFNIMDLGFEEREMNKFLKGEADITRTDEEAKRMDDNTKLRDKAANVIASIGGVRIVFSSEEYEEMEQDIIKSGFFSEKEIAEEIKNNFIADDTDYFA